MSLYLDTESRKIEVTDDPIIILRCEIEACIPSRALEECFSIKHNTSADQLDSLIVENTGYENILVMYSIRDKRSIDLLNKSKIGVKGNLEIQFNDKQMLFVPNDFSTVMIPYSKGENFCLQPGDKIYCESKALIQFINDDDWGDDWEW